MGNVMSLSPKMAQQYADRAAKGDYEYTLGGGIYIWFVGNQKVCVIGLNHPVGHIEKLATSQTEQAKKTFAREQARAQGEQS